MGCVAFHGYVTGWTSEVDHPFGHVDEHMFLFVLSWLSAHGYDANLVQRFCTYVVCLRAACCVLRA